MSKDATHIDPKDLAPHNAKVSAMFAARLAAVEAIDTAKARGEVVNKSGASVAATYGLDLALGDDWNPETGEIKRAPRKKDE